VDAPIAGIAIDPLFFTMEQESHGIEIMDVGRRRMHVVHETSDCIHTDVQLHAKIPGLTFLGGTHLKIPLAGCIFGGTRRGDDRGIDNACAITVDLKRAPVIAVA